MEWGVNHFEIMNSMNFYLILKQLPCLFKRMVSTRAANVKGKYILLCCFSLAITLVKFSWVSHMTVFIDVIAAWYLEVYIGRCIVASIPWFALVPILFYQFISFLLIVLLYYYIALGQFKFKLWCCFLYPLTQLVWSTLSCIIRQSLYNQWAFRMNWGVFWNRT